MNCDRHGFVDLSSNLLLGDGVNLVVATARIKSLVDEELMRCLLQYGTFEIALRHVKLNSLSIPKEDFAIVFTVALYEVNCFWIEGVVSDGYKRHGRTSLAAILPVRRAA